VLRKSVHFFPHFLDVLTPLGLILNGLRSERFAFLSTNTRSFARAAERTGKRGVARALAGRLLAFLFLLLLFLFRALHSALQLRRPESGNVVLELLLGNEECEVDGSYELPLKGVESLHRQPSHACIPLI